MGFDLLKGPRWSQVRVKSFYTPFLGAGQQTQLLFQISDVLFFFGFIMTSSLLLMLLLIPYSYYFRITKFASRTSFIAYRRGERKEGEGREKEQH